MNTNHHIDDLDSKKSMFGLWIGLGLFVIGMLLYPLASGSSYQSSSDFHAAMEIFGSILGIAAGSVFLVQFYESGKRFYLCIGMAFLLNGGEDMAHGLFAYGTFEAIFVSRFGFLETAYFNERNGAASRSNPKIKRPVT